MKKTKLILSDLAKLRKSGQASGILPDSKSQVTLIYNEDNKPIGCDNIVVSTQHESDLSKSKIFDYLYPIIKNVLPNDWMPPEEKIFINPIDYYFSNSISRASKVMSECRSIKIKQLKSGTNN